MAVLRLIIPKRRSCHSIVEMVAFQEWSWLDRWDWTRNLIGWLLRQLRDHNHSNALPLALTTVLPISEVQITEASSSNGHRQSLSSSFHGWSSRRTSNYVVSFVASFQKHSHSLTLSLFHSPLPCSIILCIIQCEHLNHHSGFTFLPTADFNILVALSNENKMPCDSIHTWKWNIEKIIKKGFFFYFKFYILWWLSLYNIWIDAIGNKVFTRSENFESHWNVLNF